MCEAAPKAAYAQDRPTTDLGHGASFAQNSHTVSAAASGWWDPCRRPFSACAAVRRSMACEDQAGGSLLPEPKRRLVVVIVQGFVLRFRAGFRGRVVPGFWNIYPAHDFAGRLCEGCVVGGLAIDVCLTGGLSCSGSRPAGRIEKKFCALIANVGTTGQRANRLESRRVTPGRL
ncbi:hypothetical protein BT67DRAFT_10881 [Trichocladium antarcticum]|uniref:Uncharacterized protein n=1 Tax=Trichocladium antarcticum TaxID=1450529 RepID=A0AAN6USM2_9PEZI|nr:hypothetical protein BT67DRAFT_10881 [Trichocladium antarcticum]